MKTLCITIVLAVVALGVGCSRNGGRKSSRTSPEPKVEVREKTLEEKIAAYKRADLEKLLAECFAAREQERKIAAADKARESSQKQHVRVVVDKNNYRAQLQAKQNVIREAEEKIALLKKALPQSSGEVEEVITNYIPEKMVWYLASFGEREYAVGVGTHTTYSWYQYPLGRWECRRYTDDTLRIVAVNQTNAPPAETNGPPCK